MRCLYISRFSSLKPVIEISISWTRKRGEIKEGLHTTVGSTLGVILRTMYSPIINNIYNLGIIQYNARFNIISPLYLGMY